jgi:AcrR family transcriptional regulator
VEIITAAWAVAAELGVAGLSLRDVARRVGMQPPSLYSYFASKSDIYDAMFGQAWADFLTTIQRLKPELPDEPRAALKFIAHAVFDWGVTDPARYLLTSQRTIPGFEPSPAAYQPALDVMDLTLDVFGRLGVPTESIDLYTAIVGGLVAQQVANDPGGDRWKRQVDPAMDAFCDYVGLPPTRLRPTTRRGKR